MGDMDDDKLEELMRALGITPGGGEGSALVFEQLEGRPEHEQRRQGRQDRAPDERCVRRGW